MLSQAQLQALKADILADPALANQPKNADANTLIAAVYNLTASPAYWVWRTAVSRADIYNTLDFEGNSWNWTTYKNQGIAEQNAWTQIFMGDQANFAQPNVRAGVAAIFTGSGAANAQRDHCLSVGRRQCTRAEKLFAAGLGTSVAPSVMTFEGALTYQEVESARDL